MFVHSDSQWQKIAIPSLPSPTPVFTFQAPRLPWLQRAQAPRRRKWTPHGSCFSGFSHRFSVGSNTGVTQHWVYIDVLLMYIIVCIYGYIMGILMYIVTWGADNLFITRNGHGQSGCNPNRLCRFSIQIWTSQGHSLLFVSFPLIWTAVKIDCFGQVRHQQIFGKIMGPLSRLLTSEFIQPAAYQI